MAVIVPLGLLGITHSWRDSCGLLWRQGSHGLGRGVVVHGYLSHAMGRRDISVGPPSDESAAWGCGRGGSSLHEQHGSEVVGVEKIVD